MVLNNRYIVHNSWHATRSILLCMAPMSPRCWRHLICASASANC